MSKTAIEIELKRAALEKRLRESHKLIEDKIFNPAMNNYLLWHCSYHGICINCIGSDWCQKCGGTGVHREILRQTF